MTTPSPEPALDAIRREIDSIDDQLLALLQRRFAATARVKASKASDGSIATSPLRPAREAGILRRLTAKSEETVSPGLLVRLWRVILSASSQSQAPITLHIDNSSGTDLGSRLLIGQHFCDMPVEVHQSAAHALEALRARRGDLAIIATQSEWAAGIRPSRPASPRVIGSLPTISHGSSPDMLVLGYAEPQQSGEDETLLISPGPAPKLSTALWQAVSGSLSLTSLPGYFASEDVLPREITSQLQAAFIAGRYPRPLKVTT